MDFTGMLYLQIYCCWKSIYQELKKARTCLLEASLWKIIKALWSITQVSLFLLTGETGISEYPGL